MTTALHPVLTAVTRRIAERSARTRGAYLARIDRLAQRKPGADRMGCANVAHAFAALPANDKLRVVAHLVRCGTGRPADERTKTAVELYELLNR